MRQPASIIEIGGHALHFWKPRRDRHKVTLLYKTEDYDPKSPGKGILAYDPPQPTGTEPKKKGTRLVYFVAALAAMFNV